MAGFDLFPPIKVFIGNQRVAMGTGNSLEWHPLADGADAGAAGEHQVAMLASLMEKQGAHKRLLGKPRLDIVVADGYTRWLLLPWQNDVAAPEEKFSLAHHRFREIYGESARHWRIAQADAAPGADTPCCAIDGKFARGLEELAATRGYRLGSLRPLFAAAYSHWRSRLPKKLLWFGVVEDKHITLGLRRDGRWLALHAQPLDDANHGDSLAGIMTRRALSVGLAPDAAPLYLCGNGSQHLTAPLPGIAVAHLGEALRGLESRHP